MSWQTYNKAHSQMKQLKEIVFGSIWKKKK